MQPTPRTAAWSAWSGWAALPRDLMERRRLRLTVHELGDLRDLRDLPQLRRDWQRLPHQLAVYTPDQLRQLLRLESALGRWPPTAPPDRWRMERPDLEPHWRMPDIIHNLEQGPGGAGGARAGGAGGAGARGWEGAARGWAAGAVVLAVLLLLVRALERCLHRKLFKDRRRSSEEWPTPNVLATSNRFNEGSGPRLEDSDSFTPEPRDCVGADPPPPYSACAAPDDLGGDPKPAPEEPPPPYSACYFNNPKDGAPAVHFYGAHASGERPRAARPPPARPPPARPPPAASPAPEDDKRCESAGPDRRDVACVGRDGDDRVLQIEPETVLTV